MNYEKLEHFIQNETHAGRYDNYQAVMIKTLIEKNGKAPEAAIKSELQKANPEYSEDHFDGSYMFDVLKNNDTAEFNNETKMYTLLDHDSLSDEEKTKLIKICDDDIGTISDLKSTISGFQEWLQSAEGKSRLEKIKAEKRDFQAFMKILSPMDKKSVKFTDHVLFGLLPNRKNKNAIRVSPFGTKPFQNIKMRRSNEHYSEKDWNEIAYNFYSLADNFTKEPESLDGWIKDFVSGGFKGFQTGIISPILFCIDDKFPVINTPVTNAYNTISGILRWNNTISSKIGSYMDSKKKCQKLVDALNVDEFKDLGIFFLFCGWAAYPKLGTNRSDGNGDMPHKPDPKIEMFIKVLKQNKQIVLYGPPGTGKTFTAKKIAVQILSRESGDVSWIKKKFSAFQNEGSVDLVQFHPSYSYEDFIQGIKPVVNRDGSIEYKVIDGIFKKICKRKDLPNSTPKILIIDEINRGNLSKIFGELIYALEYREEKVKLPYANFDVNELNAFLIIPENLYIIGTMNTADRSISLFDTAMRRRFAFIPMMVDYDQIARKINLKKFDEQKLKAMLDSPLNSHDKKSILSLLAASKLNQKISKRLRMGREKQIGHTYLLEIINDEKQFLNVWKYQLLPLLYEFFALKPDDLKDILSENIVGKHNGLDLSEQKLLDLLRSIISA